MKKYPMKRTIAYKQSVQGATLVEVLVSVFLLTFGILGLMAAQLNSVAAVSESENHAIAAQAAENLAEAMQTNPNIIADSKRQYTEYLTSDWVEVDPAISSCESATPEKNPCSLVGHKDISKTELATAQLGEFQYVLRQMPNTVDLKYAICPVDSVAKLAEEAKDPSKSLTDAKCLSSTTADKPVVIKVIWSSMGSEKETDTGIPDTAGKAQLYYLVLSE